MTLVNAFALAAVMAVLAAIPSVSVLTVTARAAAYGFMHGAAATAGIVAGDLIFILIAIVGLSVLAEAMGGAFVWIRYLGGAYLIVQGVLLYRSAWRSAPAAGRSADAGDSSPWASFMAGLLLTLADQKAILFYLGFFPAFLDLQTISMVEVAIVVVITVVTVGGVKLVYAILAARARGLANARTHRGVRILAAAVMCSVGLAVVVKG